MDDENDENISEQLYTNVKVPLKKVLKHYDLFQPIIEKTVCDMNDLVMLGYMFIYLYLLKLFHSNEKFPTINKQFILDCLKTICSRESNRGVKKNKKKDATLKDKLKTFYKDEFSVKILKEDGTPYQISITNRTHIIEQIAKQMLTCIKTNITTHYYSYLCKYINAVLKKPKTEEIKKIKDKKERKELYKVLNQDMRDVKTDMATGQISKSKDEYHQWLKENMPKLIIKKGFPTDKNVAYDVKARTDKYYQLAFYINSQLELMKEKPYVVIPQRQSVVPKHVKFNLCSITDLLGSCEEVFEHYNKSELVLHAKDHENYIWEKVLKTETKSIFKMDKFCFYNEIVTDGFSCSILFIDKKFRDKKYGDKIEEVKLDIDNYTELTSLTKEQCQEYLNGNYKFISQDPGMLDPISLIDEWDNHYQYSCSKRRVDTYTKRTNQILYEEKKKYGIFEIETEFSKSTSSHTYDYEKFKDYIGKKFIVNNKLKPFYQKILWRKLAFRRYVRTKQSENKLLDDIENFYLTPEEKSKGVQLVIFYGNNFNRSTQLKGCIPTPNKGIKRLLASRFIVLNTNEDYTSQLHYLTHTQLQNVSVPRKNSKNGNKHLHQVLTLVVNEETRPIIESYGMKPECKIFINRDRNACKNILYIGLYYLRFQQRPIEFCRKEKKTEKKTKSKGNASTRKKKIQ